MTDRFWRVIGGMLGFLAVTLLVSLFLWAILSVWRGIAG